MWFLFMWSTECASGSGYSVISETTATTTAQTVFTSSKGPPCHSKPV